MGGSANYATWPATGPISGTHYKFITFTEVDKLVAAGMNSFRLVFTWEAMQPTPYAVLDTLSGAYQAYRNQLYMLVDYLTNTKKCSVLLDIHGGGSETFAAYRGAKVGTSTPAGQKVEDLLANIWGQLATHFKANDRVMYGVTNEPHDILAVDWFRAAQKVIDAIRKTGSIQAIMMPGTDWTGAGSWMKNNASGWNLVDPANNLGVQAHLYFDGDSSGVTDFIVSEDIGVSRIKDLVIWARAKGLAVHISEVALKTANPIGSATWSRTLAFMNANRDVIAGFYWWSVGEPSWWGDYQYTLLDKAGAATPQFSMLVSSGAFK